MRYFVIIAVILSVLASSYGVWITQSLQTQIEEITTRLTQFEDEQRTLHIPLEGGDIALYFVKTTDTDFLLESVTRSVAETPSPLLALTLLLNGPMPQEELAPSVPPGTRLINLKIANDLATANFSEEIRTQFIGGAQLESHLVSAIVKTLTQFPYIQEVQILINGEIVESIAGHIVIDNPLSTN